MEGHNQEEDMKSESSLTILHGQVASGKRARRSKRQPKESPPEVVSLISLENQKASRSDPHSLEEAQNLLEKLLFQVEETKDSLDEVHRLQDRCLVRLW